MATIIEAPNDVYSVDTKHNPKVFLAGGISNCPDWQAELIELLKNEENVTLFNPRRANFPMDDPNAAEEQITWEYQKLSESGIIVFWFSRGSLNPIVLYELGMWGNSRRYKRIIIGCDPAYERIKDVEIQSRLAGNNQMHFTLESVADQVKIYARKTNAVREVFERDGDKDKIC